MFQTTSTSVPSSVRWAHDHLSATRSRDQHGHARALNHADSAERSHKKRTSTKALRRAMAIDTAKRTAEAFAEWQARHEARKAQQAERPTQVHVSTMPMMAPVTVTSRSVPVMNRMNVVLGIAKQLIHRVA